jgi:REP element-mobilizing transposase RayT
MAEPSYDHDPSGEPDPTRAPDLNRTPIPNRDPDPNRDRKGAEARCLPGEGPLAYFITFHTHGTWLHGDERGSMDKAHNAPGTPRLRPDEKRQQRARAVMRNPPVVLTEPARKLVRDAIQRVVEHRAWTVHALAVCTNHVHIVVSAPERPELVMNALKSWATRRLVEAGLLPAGFPAWVRHGSTQYLWKSAELRAACEYVEFGQGPRP